MPGERTRRKEMKRKKGKFLAVVVCVLACCCLFTHRRAIKALVMGEPMPKAPSWHFWVKPENRR